MVIWILVNDLLSFRNVFMATNVIVEIEEIEINDVCGYMTGKAMDFNPRLSAYIDFEFYKRYHHKSVIYTFKNMLFFMF